MERHMFTAVLCDDEAAILAELREAVDWDRLNVHILATAKNGKEALDLIIRHAPDLAIMDIRMPELSGLDAIASVRAAGIRTDFIILSGYDDFHYAQKAMHYGAKAYLLKPLNINDLTDEIYRILSEKTRNGSHMNAILKRQMELNFFRGLLDGQFPDPAALYSVLRSASTGLRDGESFVMVLAFPETLQAQNDESSMDAEQLAESLNEFLPQIPHLFFSYKDGVTGIFNQSAMLPGQLAEQVLSFCKEAGISPLIGIGDSVSGLMQCQYSYSRALTALTYRLYGTGSGIFPSGIICTAPPKKTLADIDYLPLIQHIIKRDLPAIKQFCADFMSALLYVKMPPPSYIFSTCYALLYQVEQELNQYSHEEISEITSPQSLYRCQTISEISAFLTDTFSHLSEYIDAVYGYSESGAVPHSCEIVSDDEIINAALGYIRDHIADHLKINDIAKAVHLSPSYFAIYFKNKANICLRDYLQQEKMEYARRSLVNPDNSINELAYTLGYRDYRSFSRAFKNAHGVTPSDFQNRYRH